MAKASQNRPFKFGEGDRKQLIVQDSEVSMACINDTSGNPIFVGRAKAGEPLSEDRWQIRKIAYDSNSGVTRVTWPQDDNGDASTDYEFVWNSFSDLTITNISQANPGTVTVSAIGSLQNGDQIAILGVSGMTEVNFTGSNLYTVTNIAGSSFDLSGVDTSAYTAYSSGGTVVYGEVTNYTYS